MHRLTFNEGRKNASYRSDRRHVDAHLPQRGSFYAAQTVNVRSSKIVISIAEALKREGFIANFEIVKNPATPAQNDIKLLLKYGRAGEQVINLIERVSKPGRRVYAQKDALKPVLRGMGCQILTTSKRSACRTRKLGRRTWVARFMVKVYA